MLVFKIVFFITLYNVSSQAATIKQLLNDQSLAIVELDKGEEISSGDNFILNDGKSQCLLKVLTIDKKIVTVSTEGCPDKSILIIGKKTEKSLFDPNLIKAKDQNAINEEKLNEVEQSKNQIAPENAELPKAPIDNKSAQKFNVTDIMFFPEQGQFAGRTSYSSNRSNIEISDLNIKIDSSYSAVFQSLAFGIGDRMAFQLEVPYLIDRSSTTNGVASTTVVKKGFKTPAIGFGFRNSEPEVESKYQYYEFGIFYSSKGPDDNFFSSDFIGLSITQGNSFDDKSRSIFGLNIVNYNATTDTEAQTYYSVAYNYQNQINNITFFQIEASLSTYSAQRFKTSNTSIVYDYIPSVQVGFGKNSEKGNLGFSINYEISSTNASYKPGSASYNMSHGTNKLNGTLEYSF